MKDKELDQILQHALTPTVSDEEIKVNYEMEGRPMMKKKNYFKPAVALVACAGLVAGIGFGNLPDRIFDNMSHKTDTPATTKEAQNTESGFVVKVKAAETKELKQGEKQLIVYPSDCQGESWAGNDKDKVVSYAVETPLVCEGKNMDTITYSVDKGFFRIVTPKKMSYVIDGEEYKPSDRFIENFNTTGNQPGMTEKYYKSYTVSAKDQNRKGVSVEICDTKKVSDELYDNLWTEDINTGEKEMAVEAETKNKIMNDPQITCKVNYKEDSTEKSESIKVVVKHEVMSYKAATDIYPSLSEKFNILDDVKRVFVTFERR